MNDVPFLFNNQTISTSADALVEIVGDGKENFFPFGGVLDLLSAATS